MSPTRTCPRCDASFSADVIDAQVGGVCPRCLFQLVLGESGDATLKAPSAATEPAMDVPKIMGNYEILGMVGSGGMGKVYKAKQRGLDRFVAIKVLGSAGVEEIERFFREARASAKLRHPNIIPIHEVVSHEGRYFYAMDFVEGKTLERAVKDGAISVRQGLEVLAKAARAIHFAHENGVVHRDIKPANILLDGRGEPMVADFGLAKDISSEAGLTQSGYLLGTPSYMAPEQAEPDRKAEVDAQSDVYSLGATLYFILTGRPPHEGRSVYEVIAKVVGSDPAAPRSLKPDIHRDIETMCLKALRKDRAARYASAKELADDLERFLAGEPILARPIGFVESLALKARRHRKAILAGIAAAAVALASLLVIQRTRPSHLRLVTQPAGAAVEVNGLPLDGVTPFADVPFPAGRIEITVRKSGYRAQVRTMDLQPGATYPVDLTLRRSTGLLNLSTSQPGCTVILRSEDGNSQTLQCPVEQAEIPAGSYSFLVSREDCIDAAGSFELKEDGILSLLRTPEPRYMGGFRTKEGSIRTLQFDSQNDDWCVLTTADRYYWTSSFPNPNPKGRAPVEGIAELLVSVRIRDLPGTSLVALWARSDGTLEATDNVYYDIRSRLWTYAMENGRVATVVPIPHPKESYRLLVTGIPNGGAARTTPLELVSHEQGTAYWKSSVSGVRREARQVPDLDGDGKPDLLIWGEGASVLSGTSGKEILAVAEPSSKVLAAGVRAGSPGTIVLATPEGAAALEFPLKRRWENPARSATFEAASILEAGGTTDLLVLREGFLQRLDGGTGRSVWVREDLRPRTAEPHLALDADLDGVQDLVFRDETRMVCVSGTDGRTLWTYGLPSLGRSRVAALGAIDHGGRSGKLAVGLQSGEFFELASAVRFEGRELQIRSRRQSDGTVPVEAGIGQYPDLILVEEETLSRRSLESGKTMWNVGGLKGLRGIVGVPGTGVVLALSGAVEATSVLALSESDGRSLWSQDVGNVELQAFGLPGAAGSWSVLLAVVSNAEGVTLTCREALTGKAAWTQKLPGRIAGLSVGSASPHQVAVTLLERDAVPGFPELNGRIVLLSAAEGRVIRSLAACVPGPTATCTFTDLDGDERADLLLLSEEWAQGVHGETGKILWMRHLPYLSGRVYPREGAQGRELILSGYISHALRPRDGAVLRSVNGEISGFPGDLWVSVPLQKSWSFSRVDPGTFKTTGRSYERGMFRPGGDRVPPVFFGGRLFRIGFGQRFDVVGRVHLLPIIFEAPGETRVRRTGPGGMLDLPFDRPEEDTVEKVFPNTARGAAEAFLHAVYRYDGAVLRARTVLEGGTDWPSPDLANAMLPEERSGLGQWLLNRPQELRFTGDLLAEIRDVRQTGDEAIILLNRALPGIGESLRARLLNGSWQVSLRLTADDIRRLNRSPNQEFSPVLAAFKTIMLAEGDFKNNDRDKDNILAYWTGDLAGLHHREGAKLIPLELAQADDSPLPSTPLPPGGKPVPYHGYLFRALLRDEKGKPYAMDLNQDGLPAENQLRYCFCAYPADPGQGRPTFIVSEALSIMKKDTKGKPVEQFPADPANEGWRRGQ